MLLAVDVCARLIELKCRMAFDVSIVEREQVHLTRNNLAAGLLSIKQVESRSRLSLFDEELGAGAIELCKDHEEEEQ